MKRTIGLILALCLATFYCISQEIHIEQKGDTLNFYLPSCGNKQTIIIDSVLISRNNNRVICDLKGKPRLVRANFPGGEVFFPANRLLIDKYRIGTYVLATTYIDSIYLSNEAAIYFLDRGIDNTNILCSALLSPAIPDSYKTIISYRYDGLKSIRTTAYTTVSFSDNRFLVERSVESTREIPWEIVFSALIILMASVLSNKLFHEWHATNRKRRRLSYDYLTGYSSFALIIVCLSPAITTTSYKETLFMFSATLILAIAYFLSLVTGLISAKIMEINRWIGLLVFSSVPCIILWQLYGLSPLLIFIPASILPAVLFNRAIQRRWGSMSGHKMVEVSGKAK